MKEKIIDSLKIDYICKCILFFCLSQNIFGQDTIKLTNAPKVIFHSWYPEHKSSPNLKIGESKIIMTLTPDLDSTKLRNCIIELRTSNKFINIEETGKKYPSQFLIKVAQTNKKYAEFEAWLLLENKTLMIFQNGNWVDIKDVYPVEGNRVKIDLIKVKLIK